MKYLFGLAALAPLVLGLMIFTTASASLERGASHKQLLEKTPHKSNKDEFVSSSACRACHPNAYHTWHRSYHRSMTQLATPETVVGDFDGVRFDYFGKSFLLERRGDEFWAKVDEQWRRVVQTTGSHNYQMYWLASQTKNSTANRLENLPLAYLIKDKKWVRRNDIFMVPPEVVSQPEGVRVWNDTCIACHSTHGRPNLDTPSGVATEVAELGIACESCHGPALEHIRQHENPFTRYRSRLTEQSDSSIVNPSKLTPAKSSQICGQCHSISAPVNPAEWDAHGTGFRAGHELDSAQHVLRHPARVKQPHNEGLSLSFLDKYFWRDGMVRISGREYNGLIESACHQRGAMSCLSCHSMHHSDPVDQLKLDMDTDQACLQCHQEVGDNLSAHTHHTAESSGSRCYNCHMPHTTFGLVKAIRSHEIDVPNVRSSVATGRPNACNLCHLDKTLDWTNGHLSTWYGMPRESLSDQDRKTAASLNWLIAGDAGQRAIIAWHAGWTPAQSTSQTSWMAPFLAELLDDDYAVVRSLAGRALKSLPGMQDLEYDYTGPSSERRLSAERVIELWNQQPRESIKPESAEELLLKAGKVDYARLFDLLHRRDDRPVDLLE